MLCRRTAHRRASHPTPGRRAAPLSGAGRDRSRSTRAPAPEAAREPAAPVAPTPPPPGAPRNAASPLRALSHDAPAPRDDGSPADRETPPGCDETPSAPAASPASPRPSSWRSFSLVSPGSPNILLQSKDALLQLQFIL